LLLLLRVAVVVAVERGKQLAGNRREWQTRGSRGSNNWLEEDGGA